MTDYLTASLGFGADDSPRASYTLHVNGVERPVADAWIGESLLYVLRERLGLAGAKGGCEQGECGACSVQVDGQLTAACLVPAALAAGVEIRTVEGLAAEGIPSDVQQALADSGAVQCGYCAPGLAMAVHDLLERNHHPSELEARQALCGNLCRCTGYQGALAAVRAVAESRSDATEDDDAPAEPGSAFFAEGPMDGLVEAASPVEELVPLAMPELDETAVLLDDEELDTELPVYVDVPPQHDPGYAEQPGYESYENYGGSPDPGYQDAGYGGEYGRPPYPGGPFGGRFPGQADGPGHRSASALAVEEHLADEGGSLLLETMPEEPALDPSVTGARKLGAGLGAGLRAQTAAARRTRPAAEPAPASVAEAADSSPTSFDFSTGSFRVGALRADLAGHTDPGATGSFQVEQQHAAFPTGGAPQQSYGTTGAFPAVDPSTTGAFRLDGLHGGLPQGGAGVPPQAYEPAYETGSFRVDELHAAFPDAGVGVGMAHHPQDTGSVPVLDPSSTGSFRLDELRGVGVGLGAEQPYPVPPPSGGQSATPVLDPATGVYVLPHQHGQESGS